MAAGKLYRLILHGGKPAVEVRPAYFLAAFARPIETMRIVSFGRCNFHCPYCKREGQYVDGSGNIVSSVEVPSEVLFAAIDEALAMGQRIRLSGGDPCAHVSDSLEIARYCEASGQKVSVAHNGSSPEFVRQMLPYLDFAAIDLKAASAEEFGLRAGLRNGQGAKMLRNSLRVQSVLSRAGVLVDVRTCVFSTTTLDDLLEAAGLVASAGDPSMKFWTVRQYSPITGLGWSPLPRATVVDYLDHVAVRFPELRLGLRAKWEEGGFLYWKEGQRWMPPST